MAQIPQRFQFQPTAEVRQRWLGTRKYSTQSGKLTLHGFYRTDDYSSDNNWFIMAFIIEFVALTITLYGGIMKGGFILIGAIIAVILFIVLDFIGLIFCHSKKEIECEQNNNLKIENDPIQRNIIIENLKRKKAKIVVGYILLGLSALLKVAAVFLLISGLSLVYLAIFSIFYIFVIYIHISHSGYWFAEFNTQRMIKKQYLRWLKENELNNTNNNYTAIKRETRHKSSINLDILPTNPIIHGQHSLSLVDTDTTTAPCKTIYTYSLKTSGLLLDDDIPFFISGKDDTQATEIGSFCLKHQLQNHR